MKTLILLSALVLPLTAMSAQDKCYKSAQKAAFKFAKEDGEVTTMTEFINQYGTEEVEIQMKNGWQKEYWSFVNTSKIISVTVDAVGSKCIVKNVETIQNDQDWE